MIDYTQPYQRLTISTANALQKDFDWEEFRANSPYADLPAAIWNIHYVDDMFSKMFNLEWIEQVRQLSLPIAGAMIFYRDPWLIYPEAHVDLRYNRELAQSTPAIMALNWVFTPNDDSYMTWYDVELETGKYELTPVGTPYRSWPLKEIEDRELARLTIGDQLTMVNVGLAHNVIVNKNPRWVISLRFKWQEEAERRLESWKDAVDYFNALGLIK